MRVVVLGELRDERGQTLLRLVHVPRSEQHEDLGPVVGFGIRHSGDEVTDVVHGLGGVIERQRLHGHLQVQRLPRQPAICLSCEHHLQLMFGVVRLACSQQRRDILHRGQVRSLDAADDVLHVVRGVLEVPVPNRDQRLPVMLNGDRVQNQRVAFSVVVTAAGDREQPQCRREEQHRQRVVRQ